MPWLDITILVIIAISAVLSLFRGFIRETLSLISWIIAFFIAKQYHSHAAQLSIVQENITAPFIQLAVGWIALFLLSIALLGLINYMIGKMIADAGLSGTDRMLGMLFGAIRGVFVVTLIVMCALLTSLPEDPVWQESKLVYHFQVMAEWFSDQLKEHLKDVESLSPLVNESQTSGHGQ